MLTSALDLKCTAYCHSFLLVRKLQRLGSQQWPSITLRDWEFNCFSVHKARFLISFSLTLNNWKILINLLYPTSSLKFENTSVWCQRGIAIHQGQKYSPTRTKHNKGLLCALTLLELRCHRCLTYSLRVMPLILWISFKLKISTYSHEIKVSVSFIVMKWSAFEWVRLVLEFYPHGYGWVWFNILNAWLEQRTKNALCMRWSIFFISLTLNVWIPGDQFFGPGLRYSSPASPFKFSCVLS